MAGAGIFFEARLLVQDHVHSVPVGRNISGRPPQVAPSRGSPLPHSVHAILAEGINDWPPGGLQRLVHLGVSGAHHAHLLGLVVGRLLLHHLLDEAARVVLQVVDAPLGVELGVLLLVIVRGLKTGAGLRSRRGIDANLQPFGVDIIRQRFHVGELRIRVQHSVRDALTLPGVVDIHVDVARVFHAGGDELVGGGADVLVAHLSGKEVPAVPAHRRRKRNLR